ncbi:hypothetical protein [Actinokineospora sp. HUAS TT18]|uniref:hypothetical protein n=1 Tax=Actinokineospora sp. HUAS TT18 TaxID=3447451 RepID=UPI003F5273E1
MSDLESLRAALREPPPTAFSPIDLDRVMAEGSRLRRRRQLRVVGGSVAVVATVTAVAVVGAAWLRPSASVEVGTPPTISSTSPPATTPPTATEDVGNQVLGELVRTGTADSAGELVFYFHDLGQGRFGVSGARRAADGTIVDRYATNETVGHDKAPGFHGASVAFETGRIPAFGYYSGPAAKITAKIGGKTVQAHQAAWSLDPSIKVWWFDYSTTEPTKLAAFDAAGKPLPLGNDQFGRG